MENKSIVLVWKQILYQHTHIIVFFTVLRLQPTMTFL